MALIDHFLPPIAFAAMLASEANLADTPYDTARADMDRLLDRAVEAARREHPDQADDALFAVCAFADETVLDSSWPGRHAWMRRKLQEERFHTANAGWEFYERFERLSADAHDTADAIVDEHADENHRWPEGSRNRERRELLEVYLACLTLGFRGRYDDDPGRDRLGRMADAGLERLMTDSRLSEEKVFPEAYSTPLPAAEPDRFPPALRAIVFFGGPLLLAAVMYGTYWKVLSAFVRNWMAQL